MTDSPLLDRLSAVTDPTHGRDIVSANMVRGLHVEDGTAKLTVMMTTYQNPHTAAIEEQVKAALLQADDVDNVEVSFAVEVPPAPGVAGNANVPAKHLIAVSSGKGGVGKSTVAANLAIALAQTGARVGLMDADILGPNLPMLMGVKRLPPPQPEKLVPAEAYGTQLISMGFLVDADKPLIWRGPMLHHAIRQLFVDVAWDRLDYMVIDLPPGTGDAQLTLAQLVPLTGAIIVTQPQEVALSDARRGLAMFNTVNVGILGVVENMAGDFFGSGGGEAFAKAKDVPFLGRVPLDPNVRVGGDEGRPVVVDAPESPAAVAFSELAQQVALLCSALALAEDDDTPSLTTIG